MVMMMMDYYGAASWRVQAKGTTTTPIRRRNCSYRRRPMARRALQAAETQNGGGSMSSVAAPRCLRPLCRMLSFIPPASVPGSAGGGLSFFDEALALPLVAGAMTDGGGENANKGRGMTVVGASKRW